MKTLKHLTLIFSMFFILNNTHAQQLEDYIHKNSDGTILLKGKTRPIQQSDRTNCLSFDAFVSEGKMRMGTWTFYYNDGSVMMEGNYVNSVPVGYWYANHPNGKKYFDVTLENNRKYCEDRKCPMNIITFKGDFTFYWEDGSVSTKYSNYDNLTYDIEFVNPKIQENVNSNNNYSFKGNKYLSGINFEQKGVYEYDSSGKLIEIKYTSLDLSSILKNYNSYTRADEWEQFYPSKKLQGKGHYDPFSNKRDGEWHYFNENGDLSSKGSFEGGEKSGLWVTYHSNKKLKTQEMFKGGKNDGKYESYYENGKIKAKGNFLNDEKDGLWEYYYESGVVQTKVSFLNDIQHGNRLDFYESGNKQSEASYNNGKINGVLTNYFDATNKIKNKGSYINGDKDGLHVFYFQNGSIRVKENFWNGVIVNSEDYYPSGKILNKRTFFNGEVTAINDQDIYFNENGEEILKNGTGKAIVFHDNGSKSFEANYVNGCRDGIATWYYDNGQIDKEVMYRFSEIHKPLGLRWEVLSSYDRNGNPRDKGTLKNGNGTWINYDANNEPTVTTYKNGVSVGN